MKRHRLHAPGLALLLGALVVSFILPLAQADVIGLRTGEVVKGRPLARFSNADTLVIEDLVSGNLRAFAWRLVEATDRDRLLSRWHRKGAALAPVAGQRLTLALHGGAQQILRGLVLEVDETHYRLLRAGRELAVDKARVLEVAEELMDPRDIWSPAQLVVRYEKTLGEARTGGPRHLSTEEHFRLAVFAREVGAYEEAARHFAVAARDPAFPSASIAGSRLTEMRMLLREKDALLALREIRYAISLKSFRRARKALDAFQATQEGSGPTIQTRLKEALADFTARRNAYFERRASIQFPKYVLSSISRLARPKEAELANVRMFARRRLADEAFERLAASWKKVDDVTAEEARTFWANRPRSRWRTVGYGAGTFVVEPVRRKPAKARPATKRPSTESTTTLPKPPTRDQWWAAAKTLQRTHWVMAYFVEQAELFEVAPKPTYKDCPRCHGRGSLTLRTPSGLHRYVCTRCAGTRRDKRIRYR